jgi:hypothetical protein
MDSISERNVKLILQAVSTVDTYFEAGEGRGAGLGGDHAAEAGDAPGPHVVVLGADGHQVLLRQRHFSHRGPEAEIILLERDILFLHG